MADIQVANSDADLSGNTLVTEENAYTITGLHSFSRSTNAPFAVNSGAAVVANLDVDKLDGQEGTYYLAAANVTGTLAVGKGGTGATTLTDGGVLIGNGTGAIVALAVLADGEVLVGDGTTDPTPESGATLRTSVGVGTGDSPQFTGIELGHASDTTLTKASSGDVNIEGNIIYRAGGTDVPVTDGGTGVGTLTDGGVLLGNGTGDIQAMSVLADSEMIVGDGTTDPVAETGATLRTSIGCDVATNITSGTMATARLGSGTASSGTFLRGDSSWTAVSATSAAGSDTQVQYNDGGTAFGGDAGLVYNDSTDVLTSGKLATTDTSATSIDVAGGITAGTSNIAIVNAVGKIPELSSSYLADLSGANLTGISAGKVLQVQSAYYTAQMGSTSSTFATTNVSDTITLADSDNKCLVIASTGGIAKTGNTSVQLRISRAISGGATTIIPGTGNWESAAAWTADAGTNQVGGSTITTLDDPTTASEITYTIEFANAQNVSNTYVQVGNGRSSITLIEIEV